MNSPNDPLGRTPAAAPNGVGLPVAMALSVPLRAAGDGTAVGGAGTGVAAAATGTAAAGAGGGPDRDGAVRTDPGRDL